MKRIPARNAFPKNSNHFRSLAPNTLIGTRNANQTKRPVRLVGYKVAGVRYRIGTNRRVLTAELIAPAFKLRRDIENFLGWWKKHLTVYHLISRTFHGMMVLILAGLITYLLLAIHCQEIFQETVSIKRGREWRFTIQKEFRYSGQEEPVASLNVPPKKSIRLLPKPDRKLLI